MTVQTFSFHAQSDKKLRSRVKLLGKLIGNVLLKHERPEVFHAVESLRTGFIQLRKRDSEPLRKDLIKLIAGLDPQAITQVIRAFAIYFNLVNIAEEDFLHRLRRVSVREHGHAAWVGSFNHTIEEFKDQGVDAEGLRKLFDSLSYKPVFTAHPTESRRRTVMYHQRQVFTIIDQLTDPRLSPLQRDELVDALQRLIEILWLTNEVRSNKPTVIDEIKLGLHYFQRSLFEAVKIDYRHLERAVIRIYGEDEYANPVVKVPSFIEFGSWIGGDRDGNPNVTPQTTRTALLMQADEIFSEHLRQIYSLTQVLTQSTRWFTPGDEFLRRLRDDEAMGYETFDRRRDQFAEEVYRRKLYYMHHRLRQNLLQVRAELQGEAPPADGDHAYTDVQDFLDDLYSIRDSLQSHGEYATANGELKDCIRVAETFGFHLTSLDLRQESSRHTQAVEEIFRLAGGPDYAALDEAERIALLAAKIDAGEILEIDRAELGDDSRQTLEVFELVREMRPRLGRRCIGSYVISMTHRASHIMEVMYLAFLTGLAGRNAGGLYCELEIAPLFETIEDLDHIDEVLDRLLGNEVYRQLLVQTGGRQEVMLGYSDSCKDGGIMSAAWGLYRAQQKVVEITSRHGLQCRMFHGRGGTITRGGGPTHDAIMAQPPGTLFGQIKFTEQGEVLSHKYGNAETANYELAMGITGLMKASLGAHGKGAKFDAYHADMQALAALSERSYRLLTDDTEGFFEYFYESTPVSEIGLMNIGSRPSHRRKGDLSKASVRAIPWVFGWNMSRTMMPAWYGVGDALEQWTRDDAERWERLREMNRRWPFFAAMISNLQMSLFKSDMRMALEYSKLCTDRRLAETIFGMIRDENRRSRAAVLKIAEIDGLLANDPVLTLSLSRRDPYLDPLGYLQVELLRKYRDESQPEADRMQWQAALLSSINAIAAGLRNTG